MTAETTTALTLFALCLAPIVLVETTIAVFNHYQRKRERHLQTAKTLIQWNDTMKKTTLLTTTK